MTGHNELILNETTMIEAMQFWLNSQMVNPPKVKSVKTAKGDSHTTTFSISLESNDAAIKGGDAMTHDGC